MCKISKVKNFEGMYFNCSECGRSIKHAFKVENKKGYVYGSECVYKAAGISTIKAKREIKKLKGREKTLSQILAMPKRHGWEDYKEAHGFSDDEMQDHFLERGSLS